MQYSGIDVSEAQGQIDWEKVSRSNIKFSMICATYYSSGVDAQFRNNMEEILKTNICFGVYHRSNAQSIVQAQEEATHFLSVIKRYDVCYPVALEIENEFDFRVGKDFFTNIILAFSNVVKNAGYEFILYMPINLIETDININLLGDTHIWLGDLTRNESAGPSYTKNVVMWRYSDMGSVGGINGSVNMDVSCINPFNNKNTKKEGTAMMNNTPANINMEPDFTGTSFYTVESGDTLRSISQKVFGDPEKYKKIMELNGLTRPIVFAGQTLRIPENMGSGMVIYRVKEGDKLWDLAQRFLGYGPRYDEIMALNGLTTDMIYPGQILKIAVDENVSPETYTVKSGDTLWKIAQQMLGDGKRYTEIMSVNNLENGNLRVGQSLKLPKK